MKRAILIAVCYLRLMITVAQVDANVSEKTIILYNNLKIIQNSSYFLFGQEFFNSFKYSSGSAHGDKAYSDSHEVTGAYPVVLGSDFHYYLDKSAAERGYHTEAVKWAYQQGFVITFDWHISARNTTSYTCNGSPANLAKNIANGNVNGDRDWYLNELDKAIAIINNDLVVDGEHIPIVFRPLHEMNGNWFWWGASCSGFSPADYKALYQLTVDYIKERTNSVLFCWSPNSPVNSTVFTNYYPGDAYVDILGLDMYELTADPFRIYMGTLVEYAQTHNKVAVLSETGYRNDTGNGEAATKYWSDTVLPAIINDPSGKALKIAWVLTWINASWSHPYVPHTGSTSAAKQSFINFKNSKHVVFSDKMTNLYEPLLILSTSENLKTDEVIIEIIHDQRLITVEFKKLLSPTLVTIYDVSGKKIAEEKTTKSTVTFSIDKLMLKPGFYMIMITDGIKNITQKVSVM
ncbi:MAG: T9SS type A sorting domain-containing protein [Cyclobacteriaceae bacterium]|nr:T9SS type A sorting domain-containing protein [Cyclobacteriaceae bacterium]UYN85562.1 MAG: T9SS type A sorting domain-containing protein [Cyclobacteriaceae bacterium]